MGLLSELVRWFVDPANWQDSGGIPVRLAEHLSYSAAAALTAVAIGMPIGLWVGHTGRGGSTIINIANAGRAVPTFGIILLAVTLAGVGFVPLYIALVLFAIPPVLTNTYAGVRQVDTDVRDAAFGMGMTPSQVLRRVELPNAVPLILTGIRTSATQTVATATLGAFVGMGTIGWYIRVGIDTRNTVLVLAGSLMVAGLALATEGALAALQRAVTPRGLRRVEDPAPADQDTDPDPAPLARTS